MDHAQGRRARIGAQQFCSIEPGDNATTRGTELIRAVLHIAIQFNQTKCFAWGVANGIGYVLTRVQAAPTQFEIAAVLKPHSVSRDRVAVAKCGAYEVVGADGSMLFHLILRSDLVVGVNQAVVTATAFAGEGLRGRGAGTATFNPPSVRSLPLPMG